MTTGMILAAAFLAILVAAQPTDRLTRSELQWREMFPGVTFAPAYGDWEHEKHAKYVTIQPGTEIPLHTHGAAYGAVMIEGRMENIFEGGRREMVGPGDYFGIAGGQLHAHDCLSEAPCLFYTHSDHAWDIAVPD